MLKEIVMSTMLWAFPFQDALVIGVDTDGDDKEDVRMIYQLQGQTQEGYLLYKLMEKYEDKNKDGAFTEDECTYKHNWKGS